MGALLQEQAETSFEPIARGLEQQGYVIVPQGLPSDVVADLITLRDTIDLDEFHPATIGRGQHRQKNSDIRRDRVHWLHASRNTPCTWQQWTEQLRNYLNRRLFLGLFSHESQVAVYREGDFYKPHYDAFKGEANRIVSLVTYLNDTWQPGDGGELLLHTKHDGIVEIAPKLGTLVLFLSEEILHEVKPAVRTRYSVAGWFRLNTSLLDRIDPPT